MSRDAVLVSDSAGAYRAFAGKAHIPHVGLVLSQGERTWGIYHIQNVNAYTSRLKALFALRRDQPPMAALRQARGVDGLSPVR